MTTPSHVVYNLIILGASRSSAERWAIGLGAIFPDIFVAIFFIWSRYVENYPTNYIWEHLYSESSWSIIFNLSHSFWVLPLCILIAIHLRAHSAVWFWSSALVHACIDFFVHHSDAYAHFAPFSAWKFYSPISYWDPLHWGMIVAPLEMGISFIGVIYLWHTVYARTHTLFFTTLALSFMYGFILLGYMHWDCPTPLIGVLCGF